MALPTNDQIQKALAKQKTQPPVTKKPNGSNNLKQVFSVVKDIFKGKDDTKGGVIRNTIKGLPKATLDTGLSILRAPGRATGSVVSTIGGGREIVPTTKLEKAAYGNEPIKSLPTRISETESTLKGMGFGETPSKVFAPVGVLGITALDLYPGSAGKGKVLKDLVKETSEGVIKNLLKKNIKGLTDDVIEKITPQIAKSTDKKVIEDLISNSLKEIKQSKIPSNEQIISRIQGSETPQPGIRPQEIPPQIGQSRTGILPEEKLLSQAPAQPAVGLVDSSTQAYPKPSSLAIEATARQTGDNPEVVRSVANTLQKTKTDVVEYVQNSSERVRQLVNRPDVKVTEVSDPYLKQTLYSGRVGTKMETAKNEVKDIILDIKKTGISKSDVSDFLVARHAPERNLSLGEGASGMTTREAGERLAQFEQSAKGSQIKAVADKIQALNNKVLDTLMEGEVITKELYDTLRKTYKNHVPLNRIMEGTDDIAGALSGKGFDVKSTGLFKAKGSKRKVSDVLGNVVYNYEQAVLRAEKNIADKATLVFVRNNKEILGDAFEIVSPKAIGKTFDGKPIFQKTTDPTILQMFENGKKVWIKIKDPKLALALRGVNQAKLGGIMNTIGAFTRFYSGLATRFNPEFALPNKIRDLQEIAVYLSSQKDIGMKGALKTTLRDPKSMGDIFAYLRGKDTPGARLYKEMKDLGGTTGGMGLSTKKQVELNIEKIEKLANSKTKNIANNLIEYVDNWNTLFEDSTRLSVYKQALDQGLSKERAAFLAKEASINFNRMGTGGPLINALYMFSNASIQGSTKMLRAMKNPKVLGTTMLAVGGSVAAVNEWNDRVDPNWRDAVTKWDRLNGLPVMIPSTDGGAHYVTVPISWGLKPIKVMADYAYDALSGQEFDAGTMMSDTLGAVLEAYNPVGGTDLLSALTPTILDTPSEIARNQKWSGGKIRPDTDPNAPKDIQYFSSLKDTFTGRKAISLTEVLQQKLNVAVSPADIKYAYDQLVGGAGRFINKITDVGQSVATGNPPPLDEFPMISRFYRRRTAEEIGTGATTGESKDIKETLGVQSRERFKVKMKAEDLYAEYKKLSPQEANKKAAELKKTDPEVYKKMVESFKEDKLGLTYTERLMKQLGVENGERAKYIYEQILKKPKGERNAYYASLKEKKIITEAVNKQLKQLSNK